MGSPTNRKILETVSMPPTRIRASSGYISRRLRLNIQTTRMAARL